MKTTSYNKGLSFNADFEGKEFAKLEDLYSRDGAGAIYPLQGLFINTKSKFGDKPYACTEKDLVDLPTYLEPTVKQMITDPEVIAEVNSGIVGITIRTYDHKKYGVCYTIDFVELQK